MPQARSSLTDCVDNVCVPVVEDMASSHRRNQVEIVRTASRDNLLKTVQGQDLNRKETDSSCHQVNRSLE